MQACTAHDALDSMSAESERRATAALISKFVLKADFGRDFESHLNFLVECRRAFSRMEAVQATLVHTTNQLAMRTLKRAKGKPNRRIVAFVKVTRPPSLPRPQHPEPTACLRYASSHAKNINRTRERVICVHSSCSVLRCPSCAIPSR